MSVYAGPETISSSLILSFDPSNTLSYSGTGTSLYDLTKKYTGTLDASVTYANNAFNYSAIANLKILSTVPISQFINKNYTWHAWIKGQNLAGAPMPTIGYGSGGWQRFGFREASVGNWVFSAYNGSGPPNIVDVNVGASSSTRWVFLCAVGDYTNSVIRTYYNGNYVTQGTYMDVTGNDNAFGMGVSGSIHLGWNQTFSGSISNVNLYNTVLSAAEIKQNFNALRGRFGI